MSDDLRARMRALPDELDVREPPPPSQIRRRGRRRALVRRVGGGALALALVGVLSLAQPWTWLQDEGTGPAEDTADDYPFEYSGFPLTGSGPVEREWLLTVDMPRDEVLCFDFFVEDSPAAGDIEQDGFRTLQYRGRPWCRGDVLMSGAPSVVNGGRPWMVFHTFRPEGPEKVVFGAVTSDVAEVVAEVEGAEHGEGPIDLEAPPAGFPRTDLRFFVVIYPPTDDLHLRVTSDDGSTLDERTIAATPTFARFPVTYGEGNGRVNGMVEINAEGATLCSDAYMPWASAGHLHRDIQREEGPIGPDPVVLTLFEPPVSYRRSICFRYVDPLLLFAILDEPDLYYLDFHEADGGGREVPGYLREPSQTNLEP
jgi:hypothetical protein